MKVLVKDSSDGTLALLNVSGAEYDVKEGILILYSTEMYPCLVEMSSLEAEKTLEELFELNGRVDLRGWKTWFDDSDDKEN